MNAETPRTPRKREERGMGSKRVGKEKERERAASVGEFVRDTSTGPDRSNAFGQSLVPLLLTSRSQCCRSS
jgi:hypothetical protein